MDARPVAPVLLELAGLAGEEVRGEAFGNGTEECFGKHVGHSGKH